MGCFFQDDQRKLVRSPVVAWSGLLHDTFFLSKRATEPNFSEPPPTERRTCFYLNEVREAERLPGSSPLLTKGRSQGAAILLGFQNVQTPILFVLAFPSV